MDRVTTGILDNDHKGTTGVGTIYFMDVYLNGVTTRHTWGLLEQLRGDVKPNEWSNEALKNIRKADEARQAAEQQAKRDAIKQREDQLVIDPVLQGLVLFVVTDPAATKAMNEYRSGNEKALNALVGMVIKQIRARKLSVSFDAFSINRAMQQTVMGGNV